MKRRVRKVYKKLPPHTYEAHPVANAGEASKPLIIGIIAIVAIIALSLLLLFSDQLVGKAFFTGEEANSAGAELIPATVYEHQPFSLKVKANTGSKETNLVAFTLTLPSGKNCNGITIDNLLEGWAELERKCDGNKIFFTYFSISASESELFDVAQINFPGYGQGDLQFTFDSSFQAFDSNSVDQVTKEENPLVQVKAAVCGDGDKAPTEQCDDGNTVTEACTYGQQSCMVCNNQCQQVSGATSYCGDGQVDSINGEECDGSSGCTSICKTSQVIPPTPEEEIPSEEMPPSEEVPPPPPTPEEELPEEMQQFTCGGTLPANAVACSEPIYTGKFQYGWAWINECNPTVNCRYICKEGYHYENFNCILGEEMPTEEVTPMPEEEQVNQVCTPNQYVCQGTTAYKQCKSDGSGYNELVACAEDQVCDAGVCAVSTQGTKITLTDVAPANNLFATKITATEAFTTEVTIYTILYDQEGKVLALKSEKLAGLAQGQTYTAAVNYPEANIKRKSVIVYDVKPGVEVVGSLSVQLSE